MAKRLSDVLGNALASPRVLTPALAQQGAVLYSTATVSVLSTDAAGVLYPMLRLPAHARLIALTVLCPVIAGLTDCDIGVWVAGDWNQADQAEVDGSSILTSYSFAAGTFNDPFIAIDPATSQLQLWQGAGLPSAPRPGTQYDVAFRINSDPLANGSLGIGLSYVVGS